MALMPTAKSIENLRSAKANLMLGGMPLASKGRLGLFFEIRALNSRLKTNFSCREIAGTIRYLSYNLSQTNLNGAVIDVLTPIDFVRDISRQRIDAISSRPIPDSLKDGPENVPLPKIEVFADLNPADVKSYAIRNEFVATDLASMLFPKIGGAGRDKGLTALLSLISSEIGPTRTIADVISRMFPQESPISEDMLALWMSKSFELNPQWLNVVDEVRSKKGKPVNLLILSQLDQHVISALLRNEQILKVLGKAGIKKITICSNRVLANREGNLIYKGSRAIFDITLSNIRNFVSHGTIMITSSPVLEMLSKTNNILDLRKMVITGHIKAVDKALALYEVSKNAKRLKFVQNVNGGESAEIFYTKTESEKSINPEMHPLGRKKMLSVLIPTCNGANKIIGTLESIISDLGKLPANFDWEIMICVNGTNDGTLRILEEFMISNPGIPLTILSIPKEVGSPGLVTAENILYEEAYQKYETLKERLKNVKWYIHFSDDDITITSEEGHSGIGENINLLEGTDHAPYAVSGHYVVNESSVMDDRSSLGSSLVVKLNASRKHVQFIDPVPQLYGGAMTMPIENYPRNGVDIRAGATDCWLTVHFWQRAYDELGEVALMRDLAELGPEAYPVRSNPYMPVIHPVPNSLKGTLRRMIRDMRFGELARSAGSENVVTLYERYRETAFSRMTRKVGSLSLFDRMRIAHMGNTLIFLTARWLNASETRRRRLFPDFTSYFRDDILLPAFENEPQKLAPSLNKLPIFERFQAMKPLAREIHDCLSEFGIIEPIAGFEAMEEIGRLKAMERALEGRPARRMAQIKRRSEAAFEFIKLVKSVHDQRELIFREDYIAERFKEAGIELKGKVSVERIETSGMVGIIFFVKDAENSYFVRYFDPIGLIYPPLLTETAARFITILNENLFSDVVGRQRVVTSLYPTLDTAEAQLRSKMSSHDSDAMPRIMIQRDLREYCLTLEDVIRNGFRLEGPEAPLTVMEVVEKYADLIGRLHSATWGVRSSMRRRDLAEKHASFRHLEDAIRQGNPELVRNVETADYAEWLKTKWWRLRTLRKLIGSRLPSALPDDLTHSLFLRLSPKIDIEGDMNMAITESIKAFEEDGTLGHLDFSPKNTFWQKHNRTVKMYDFETLGFIDPAIDASVALYRVLLDMIRSNSQIAREEIMAATDYFLKGYENAVSGQRDLEKLKCRLLKLTKLIFLNSFGGDIERDGLREQEREVLSALAEKIVLDIHAKEKALEQNIRISSSMALSQGIKTLVESKDYLELLNLATISNKMDFASEMIRLFGFPKAVNELEKTIFLTPKTADQFVIYDIIEVIISRLMTGLGYESPQIFEAVPALKKLVNFAQSSKSHEGVTALVHTVKLLHLLDAIRRRAAGEKAAVPPELRGQNRFLNFEPAKAVEAMVKLIGETRLQEIASADTGADNALKELSAVCRDSKSLRSFLKNQDEKTLRRLSHKLWDVYSDEFLSFLAQIYSEVNDKGLLAFSALLHDIGKIEDDAMHTKKVHIIEKIARETYSMLRGSELENYVRIASAVLRYHVLFGSVPLKEEGYEYYGQINDIMPDTGSQKELYNILTLISILDVAATGKNGKISVPGTEDMKKLYENYMSTLRGESWSDICQKMMSRGYGFSRLLSFVGEENRQNLSEAMGLVDAAELSSFYTVLNRTEKFSQFFFTLKNFTEVRNVVKLFLLITRVSIAALENDRIVETVHLRIKDLKALEALLKNFMTRNQFLQEEATSTMHDILNRDPEAKEVRFSAGGILFTIDLEKKDLSISIKE